MVLVSQKNKKYDIQQNIAQIQEVENFGNFQQQCMTNRGHNLMNQINDNCDPSLNNTKIDS